MCSLLAFLQAMAVFLSAWTLVVISFDRWMAIMFVLTPSIRITTRRALYLVAATWIFSILMALPLLFTTRSFEIQEGIENCGENWTYFGDAGEQVRKVYSSMVVILQYIVPQAVLIITYTHIGIKMWNSRVPGMQNGATKKMIVDRHESVKKLVPMVILISALFALCWLPLLILINVIPEFYPNINSWGYILYLWWFAHGLAMLHSIVNPVIYFIRNARFREGFCYFSSKLLPCIAFKEFRLLTDNNTSRSFRNRSRFSGVINPASSDDKSALVPMVILISALFALCWLPLLILINVIPEFYPNINSWGYILYLWWFAHGLAMLHSIVNPVIYFIRNARFREGFCYFSSKLLPCVAFKEFRLLTDIYQQEVSFSIFL
ncbi:hypothetical protein CRE_21057 [Caenorhabditis remanei]|uniref:G-protein coupled receptors family 1 profile domain-containing protein n=1 Tax=Caenorhabditis remanei TaxID=31234 RepID=E3NQ70_CAERE|nr:hypothetical protein CRE_21057 [Caenorhabditis remanei]